MALYSDEVKVYLDIYNSVFSDFKLVIHVDKEVESGVTVVQTRQPGIHHWLSREFWGVLGAKVVEALV